MRNPASAHPSLLARRFAAQLIDALLVLVVALILFHGSALSPLQSHDDRLEVQPLPLVPFLSGLELAYALPEDPPPDQAPWLGLVMAASGTADQSSASSFEHTLKWRGSRTTFTYATNWSLGIVVLWLLHAVLGTGYAGQTLGKRFMGLRVVRKNGEPVGYGRSCVRAVTYLPSSQIWIAVPWAVLGLTGRWWHDSAADTKVVPSTSTAGQVADAPGE